MSSKVLIPNAFTKRLATGIINLENPNIKISLHTSDPGDIDADQVYGDMTNEVASGSGYTTGGETLTGMAMSYVGDTGKWDANNVVWTALTKTFKYGLIYIDETVSGIIQPIIAKIGFDYNTSDEIQDVIVVGVDHTIVWSASGIIQFEA